jgi:hypothetical protein
MSNAVNVTRRANMHMYHTVDSQLGLARRRVLAKLDYDFLFLCMISDLGQKDVDAEVALTVYNIIMEKGTRGLEDQSSLLYQQNLKKMVTVEVIRGSCRCMHAVVTVHFH